MHPVLVYAFSFIAITIGLLFAFEYYAIKSFYLFVFISIVLTAITGKILILLFPADDPMKEEIEKEKTKLRSLKYQREIQFLYNLVQPDPKLQPTTKRISDSLYDCFDLDEKIIMQRIKQYFGESFEIQLNQPLPDLVEQIKQKYTNWLN